MGTRNNANFGVAVLITMSLAMLNCRQVSSFSTRKTSLHPLQTPFRIRSFNEIRTFIDRRPLDLNKRQATSFFGGEEDDDESKYDNKDEDLEFEKFQTASPNSTSEPHLSSDAQTQIEQQQKQIDMLMEMVKAQQLSPPPTKEPTSNESQSQSTPFTQSPFANKHGIVTRPVDELPPPLPGMFDQEGEEELLDHSDNPTFGQAQASNPTQLFNLQGGVVPVAPLKAMLFIDGTWLYYSLHRRKEEHDPIVKKFGKGWQYRYRFDWNALPRIICEQFVGQQKSLGWSANANSDSIANSALRPIEIVRASVFTSYKKSTDPKSFRVRMYNEMADANYDIHMLESTSNGPEKCVDISLAVEMLHYATVPNAYDVAILLSGDKDFIPAMVRTRQKGRKVGVTSMRTGCNRALYESPHVKDYDVVWIDDFLDQLLVPLPAEEVGEIAKKVHDRGMLSTFTLTKVILDFITQAPYDKVSSRDVGRYLKSVEFADGGTNLLDDIKLGQGGLRRFLNDRMPAAFDVIDKSRLEVAVRDASDTSYWISKKEGSNEVLLEEAKKTTFTPEEKTFLQDYQSGSIGSGGTKDEKYYYTYDAMEFGSTDNTELKKFVNDVPSSIPQDVTEYSKLTVVKLKEICRDGGLLVSGTKAILIKRIEDHDKSLGPINVNENTDQVQISGRSTEQYLIDLVKYYVVECHGYASSRDLGRFLASNQASTSGSNTALQELKNNFGGVSAFLNQRNSIFTTVRESGDGDPSNYSFGIKLSNSDEKFSRATVAPENVPKRISRSNRYASSQQRNGQEYNADPKVASHIDELVKEYLQASGGEASSRNIGRYLAANAPIPSSEANTADGKRNSALKELKKNFGSLANYLSAREETFTVVRGQFQDGRGEADPPSEHSFGVRLIY